ncbi:MAG: hypothetical protein ACSHYA_14370 [Opitutaceae bacterium]
MGKRKRNRKGKGKKKPKLHYDDKGEFRWETYFVGGKQKRSKVRTIDGMDPDEFWRQNADPIAALQAGDYELLHELEKEWWPEEPTSGAQQLVFDFEEPYVDVDIPF